MYAPVTFVMRDISCFKIFGFSCAQFWTVQTSIGCMLAMDSVVMSVIYRIQSCNILLSSSSSLLLLLFCVNSLRCVLSAVRRII